MSYRPAPLSLPHLAAVEDLLAATRGLWGNVPGARPKPAVSSPSPVVLVFRRDGGSVDTALIDSERRINRAHYDPRRARRRHDAAAGPHRPATPRRGPGGAARTR